ncbi:hypothetical protein E8P82_14190 [Arthrobacter echini]|uniref:Uncharacterized protein n=1 Tax=Arthrobacter echini TaxID=1529066 RepID=A0A4S5E0H1_9MICC|nr:hypothetical protein [Arthrobacter echini]THJ64770.1 hypothetical protein E8P82_14190 [Arthrobacter echini]
MFDEEGECCRNITLGLYSWRLADYAESAAYQRLAGKILASRPKTSENPNWDEFLVCLMLVETFERKAWFRAAERVVYYCSLKRLRITLGLFQMQDAPWRTSEAIAVVIGTLLRGRIEPSFQRDNLDRLAAFWYGHAGIERGAAFSYSDAMQIAERVTKKLGTLSTV